MSLIKMITGALTGGAGGIFSDKNKEDMKWKSGMDETHGGATGLLNQATYNPPQANFPEGHKPLNLAEAGIIASGSGAYNQNRGTFPGGANAPILPNFVKDAFSNIGGDPNAELPYLGFLQPNLGPWGTKDRVKEIAPVKGVNQNMTVSYLDSILQQFNDMRGSMKNMPTGAGDTQAIQQLKSPISILNNNPGNIKDFGVKWDGMVGSPLTDGSFLKFDSPEMGVRALTKDLRNKMSRGLNTVDKIINVYAPPSENDTGAYIDSVTQSMGIGAEDQLDEEKDLQRLIRAIIRHEGGSDALQHYNDDIILKGMNLSY